MNNTACTNCGAQMHVPDVYFGRSVKCLSCGSQFIALTFAEAEEKAHRAEAERVAEQARVEAAELEKQRAAYLQDIIDALSNAEGQHYVELDAGIRTAMEETVQRLMHKNLSTWDDLESTIFRLSDRIPGRSSFFKRQHQMRLEELIIQQTQLLTEVGNNTQRKLESLAIRLEGIKAGTTASGLAAAHEMGKQLGDGL